jgi:hypothetical protein
MFRLTVEPLSFPMMSASLLRIHSCLLAAA